MGLSGISPLSLILILAIIILIFGIIARAEAAEKQKHS